MVPEWSVLEEEEKEIPPCEWLFIYDIEGNIIKKIKGSNQKGINRMSWNLMTTSTATISIKNLDSKRNGKMVGPGKYTAQLFKRIEGKYSAIGDKVSFDVKQTRENSLNGNTPDKVVAHWENIASLSAKTKDLQNDIINTKNAVKIMLRAYEEGTKTDENLHAELLQLRNQILDIEQQFSGSKARSEVGEKNEYPTIRDYIWSASGSTTYGPTKAHLQYMNNANHLFDEMTTKLEAIKDSMAPLEGKLKKIGAPKIKK